MPIVWERGVLTPPAWSVQEERLAVSNTSATGNLNGVGTTTPSTSNANKPGKNSPDAGLFGDLLDSKIGQPTKANEQEKPKFEGLRFSQHALERMTNRGISLRPEDLVKLNEAVERAASKGSKESLILMGDNALIVSVKNRTVITAMDREAMKENVFTNIDSTVIL